MKQYWWKFLGILLVGYAVIGGLLMPLKTGITGVRIANSDSLNFHTGKPATLSIDIYNAGKSLSVKEVLLINGSRKFRAGQVTVHEDGLLDAIFDVKFGKNQASESIYTLYVKANGQWMAFPGAVGIRAGASDTAAGNAVELSDEELEADPDQMKGFPNRIILYESIRNLLYHVPMWFSMIFLLSLSAWYSIKFLNKGRLDDDLRSESLIRTAILTGILGCITGSVWASVTWEQWWPKDPKLNGVAIGMLMYLSYLLLRNGVKDDYQKARVSAVYNLFVFPVFMALIAIMPKLSGESLHPGAGGTTTFKQYDLDNTLRMFFYPAVIGWICIFTWLASLLYRYKKLNSEITNHD